ncbi:MULTISPECIES: DUF5071 domain-containing protein [unclassified Rhizobium]|uniref:DUF5071 domain-containing protein n=1 Tax=unclassified Rhizobium TaxID=2613769 RepID=UPI000713ACD5|nr:MULTISPECIES: DUF5071 domain-containing protein [unclassified Rhizobium]KQT03231.1 hypothetical protein ASG42_24805 [Rhizobium sp. Leaf391]KQU08360.1 hypothetical protein ASG68_22480 [Rhizobium sp. Leaf453]
MMTVKNLIPKSKHDLAAVKNLQKADPASITPILDQLFEWTEDGNWPVARPMADFLAAHGKLIVPLVRRVLNGNDLSYKYFCLDLVVRQLPAEAFSCLIQDLERLADNPTSEEIEEGLPELISEMTFARP